MSEKYWPICFQEANIEVGAPQIRGEDIASWAYPPGRRERYTEAGWEKAKLLNIAELDVRDFGATGNGGVAR